MTQEVEVAEAVKKYLKAPSDFAYFGELPIFTTWTLGPTINHRDADLMDKSNARFIKAVFEEAFGPESEECDPPTGKWAIITCSHWAVGWVEHLAFEVLTPEGNVSPALEKWLEIEKQMENYPVLDEDDYSEREWEAVEENLANFDWSDWQVDLPDDWRSEVWNASDFDICHESGTAYIPDHVVWGVAVCNGWVRCKECGSVIQEHELPTSYRGIQHRCPTLLEKLAEGGEA